MPPRRPDPALLEAVSRTLLQETAAFTALDVAAALDAQHRVTRSSGLFFTRSDLLVTPTLASLPVPHGTLDYDDHCTAFVPGYAESSSSGRSRHRSMFLGIPP